MHPTLQLGNKILQFLQSCGGAYETINQEIESNVFYCIGAKQYVIRETDGEIEYFACYWKVKPEDVETVKKRVKPKTFTIGTRMYVVEAASKKGLLEMIKALRAIPNIKGVFWHRPTKKDKICSFMSQHSAR